MTPNPAALMADAIRLHQAGQLADAAALYSQVIAADPRQHQAMSNLGAALRGLGQFDQAEASYHRAIALKPDFPDAHSNLANLLKHRGRLEEAIDHYKRAVALKPGEAGLYYNLGLAQQQHGRTVEAIAAYAKAVDLNPQFAEAWSNLGVALADQGAYEDAVDSQRKAIKAKPGLIQAHNNLGLVLLEQGLLDEAIASFDQALALKPDYAEGETNRIFAELYRPGVTLADMLRLSKHWSAAHAPTVPAAPPRQGGRPRLGFVSADFRQHAVGFLTIPALESLRRQGFGIACYNNGVTGDAMTQRFKEAATIWRDVAPLSDEQLAAQIREDKITILFDLAGHSRGNRLAVFARKPAPVQIAWAGYPATSGLPAMDYILTDAHQTPPGVERFYTEKLLRLPHSYVVFEPMERLPEPGPLPADRNGFVTFASFNALKKINSQVIALWGRILNAVPDSRLLLKSPVLDCAATRKRMTDAFAAHGVKAERLTLRGATPPKDHVVAMADADIALDTFPYSGGQTTLESLWMGLPVITWPGETFASRHAFGYLSTLELGELIAADAEAYVATAVRLAGNRDELAKLRSGMRQRMLKSPLNDRTGFANALSGALLKI